MTDAFIYDHVRTPRGRGKANGSLHSTTPIELASQVLRALRDRNHLDTRHVDDVVLGVVSPVNEQGNDIARAAVVYSGYDEIVAGVQLDRFCASGLEAVNTAAAKVMSGQAQLMIGGGVESMSRVPMGSGGGAWGRDPLVTYRTYFAPQGISADLIATRAGFTRNDVDSYAIESQRRAGVAWANGYFSKSVIPVVNGLGLPVLTQDEHMRPGTTLADLAKLEPSFKMMGEQAGYDAIAIQRYPEIFEMQHVHHAGNSSGIVDGSAGILIGNKAIGEQLGLKPRARIRAFATIGSEPTIMLTGPAPATLKALKNAGMSLADIDLFELNEAFAAVVLEFMRVLNVPHDKINVNGGAIAMGHPLGATGAMILGTALDELERTGKGTALATLCVGIGMGIATIIERV